jgi:hypothetical protein
VGSCTRNRLFVQNSIPRILKRSCPFDKTGTPTSLWNRRDRILLHITVTLSNRACIRFFFLWSDFSCFLKLNYIYGLLYKFRAEHNVIVHARREDYH